MFKLSDSRFKEWLNQPRNSSPVPPTNPNLPILVVGAGPAGLAAMAELKKASIAFEGIERHLDVGGLWNATNPDSVAYDNVKTNSSKATTYLDIPMPGSWPAYPNRTQALEYLQGYADRHDLRRHIRFQNQVVSITKRDEAWSVAFKGSGGLVTERLYRAVIVASGLHRRDSANLPTALADQATQHGIDAIHSSQYKNPDRYRAKRVLIVGSGNSTAEIAPEIAEAGASCVFVSVRTTPWMVPLWVLGCPADRFARAIPLWIPYSLRLLGFNVLQRLLIGHPTRLGFADPDHKLFEKFPISDRGIVEGIRRGHIRIRSNLVAFQKNGAHFERHSPEPIDAVVFATGYRRDFHFIDQCYTRCFREGRLPAFHIFHPEEPGLVFMSELHIPRGAWPVFAAQARAIASYFLAEPSQGRAMRVFNNGLRGAKLPDFKGRMFTKMDAYYVDPDRYLAWLERFIGWIRGS